MTNNITYLKRVNGFIDELRSNQEQIFGVKKPIFSREIKINNLSFSYGNTKIFNKVSFTIPKSGLTIFLGRSGAGKTTLFDLITGCMILRGKNIIRKN